MGLLPRFGNDGAGGPDLNRLLVGHKLIASFNDGEAEQGRTLASDRRDEDFAADPPCCEVLFRPPLLLQVMDIKEYIYIYVCVCVCVCVCEKNHRGSELHKDVPFN